jgi:hypothetical protein
MIMKWAEFMKLLIAFGSLIALLVNTFFFFLSRFFFSNHNQKALPGSLRGLFCGEHYDYILLPHYIVRSKKARQCITRLLRANQFPSWLLLRMPLIFFCFSYLLLFSLFPRLLNSLSCLGFFQMAFL